jgi:hypothetical protein
MRLGLGTTAAYAKAMSSKSTAFKLLWVGACLVGASAVFFLWDEHQAHILGALPYLFLLACPFMHLFMHHGHGHHHDHVDGGPAERRTTP